MTYLKDPPQALQTEDNNKARTSELVKMAELTFLFNLTVALHQPHDG